MVNKNKKKKKKITFTLGYPLSYLKNLDDKYIKRPILLNYNQKSSKKFLTDLKKYSDFINSTYYFSEYLVKTGSNHINNIYRENYYSVIHCPSILRSNLIYLNK